MRAPKASNRPEVATMGSYSADGSSGNALTQRKRENPDKEHELDTEMSTEHDENPERCTPGGRLADKRRI